MPFPYPIIVLSLHLDDRTKLSRAICFDISRIANLAININRDDLVSGKCRLNAESCGSTCSNTRSRSGNVQYTAHRLDELEYWFWVNGILDEYPSLLRMHNFNRK